MGFRDNRQSKRMLEKMGLNLEEMPNVDEVVIKTAISLPGLRNE